MPLNLVDNFVPARSGDQSLNVAERVMHNPEFVRCHRPFLPTRGKNEGVPCIVANARDRHGKQLWTKEKGEKKPLLKQVRVFDAIAQGAPVPMWALNATSLRRDDWIELDREAQDSYRQRLKLIADLQARVQVGGFDGWGRLTYEYDAMSDAHEAIIDMDGLSEGHNDAPLFLPRSVPLPFTHSDFFYSDRVLAASRKSGSGLDVFSAEQAGRRIAEMVEDVAIGIVTGPTYGTRANYFPHDLNSTWFGLANYTNRNTKTNFTAPTAGGWVPDTTYNEVLTALSTLYDDRVYGPFALYYSTDWTQYMNRVYSLSGGNTPGETLLSMLKKHPDIESVERLDRLTSTFTLFFVPLDRKYIRFLNGMGVTTWQWDTKGGLQKNFKVGVVQATLILSDYTGRCGVMHGTTA